MDIVNKINNDLVFDIKNVTCGYNSKDAVLFIKELKIPAKKIIFILGLSGIGKSTFIETLGLMNDTIMNKETAKVNFYSRTGKKVDLVSLWETNDKLQSEFRQKYLSFIFQNTNLMPNMTAGENVSINMLMDGFDNKSAKINVLKEFKKLNLSSDKYDKDITSLSGGEKQRVAFVRGLLSNFEILFGDEPTGNLDKKSASNVMDGIKQSLRDQNKGSIIVTHDPELAYEFGDNIILITTKFTGNKKKIGFIKNENLYSKKNGKWYDYNGNTIKNMKDLVKKALNFN